ncbi:hypothetical protein QYM36_004577 [Artemia franciscana]|uniref:Enoyl-CoA hydratase domain-containing protein 3, mitochondrial n=1 Tax=Artemia franciscana TaxID=6661 RepID=A0AA88IHE7_ARTSF|nr:hypothetical protein QYM36_004577 [Artemia franciscana]
MPITIYGSAVTNGAGAVCQKVLFKQQDGVARIILNDLKTRNALSLEVLNLLKDHFKSLNEQTRCVVISSTGPVFSAGHNLKELRTENGINHHRRVFETCESLMCDIINIDVPVIAQVKGLAAAAGCQLVATCDIVIAGNSATFSTPGANFGLFCSTPGIPLVRCVPGKVASYMLLTGQPITAQEAMEVGLVSKVVPENSLDAETEKVIDDILKKSKSVIALGKKFLSEQKEMNVIQALKKGTEIMVENLRLEDAQEGVDSFKEKRSPTWKHSVKTVH